MECVWRASLVPLADECVRSVRMWFVVGVFVVYPLGRFVLVSGEGRTICRRIFILCLYGQVGALLILAPFSARGNKALPVAQERRGVHARKTPETFVGSIQSAEKN